MSPNPSLESVEFAKNPDPRCPCVLLVDVSGSMNGKPIDALNEGLRRFRDGIQKDDLAARRCEVAVVTFSSSVRVERPFVSARDFDPPTLAVEGQTHMGEGIEKALDLVEERKREYRQNGVDWYRPWVFLITDGTPQGEAPEKIVEAAERIRRGEKERHVSFYAVGVEGADMSLLERVSVQPPLSLQGLEFVKLFQWLSKSIEARTNSALGDQVSLPPTSAWSSVEA